MAKRYVKNPIAIEAFRLSDDIWPEWFANAITNGNAYVNDKSEVIIKTLEGDMTASEKDYIIRGIAGEIYPCKPDIFEKAYTEVK